MRHRLEPLRAIHCLGYALVVVAALGGTPAEATEPSVAGLLEQAQREWRLVRFPEARWTLIDAQARAPDDPAVHLAWGDFWTVLREYDRAEQAYAHAYELGAGSDGLAGMGEAALARNERDRAASQFDEALRRQPDNPRALSGLAGLRLVEGKWWEAVELTRRALARDPDNPDARYRLGYGYFQYGDALRATEWFFKTFDVAPYYIFGHMHLGAGRHAVFPDDARRDTDGAWWFIERGARAWERHDYEGARQWYARALEADPHSYKARTGMFAALMGTVLTYSPIAQQYRERYVADGAAPAVPEAPQFVPGFESVSADRQEVIRRALHPFRRYLPGMLAKGARQHILPLDQGLPDLFGWRGPGGRGGDLRAWAGIRGVGGRVAASSIEDLEEAVNLGFSTFAHEFAHQLHHQGLSEEQVERVNELYDAAKEREQFLDYYAAGNSSEYFAQGVEAFVSFAKRPGLRDVHSHTHHELRAVDPDLHDFIMTLTEAEPPPVDEQVATRFSFGGSGVYDQLRAAAARARRNPDRAGAWLQVAALHLRLGDPVAAAHAYHTALKRDPEAVGAYLGLARLALGRGDLNGARRLAEAARAQDEDNPSARVFLADLHSRASNHEAAQALLEDGDDPPSAIRRARARIAERAGDHATAETHYRELLARNKNRPLLHAARARCLAALGDLDEALAAARLSVLLAPASAETRTAYGDVLFARGEVAAARRQYQRALGFNGGFAPARLGLARVAAAADDWDTARRHARAAHRLSRPTATVTARYLEPGGWVYEGGPDAVVHGAAARLLDDLRTAGPPTPN